MTFTGIPSAALEFYDHLEVENTREFWDAHRGVYESAVLQPMRDLTAELAAEFGAAKLFRPHRDLRFSRDKAPFKTHQGGFVQTAESTGYYVEVSAEGVLVAAGAYRISAERLARIRRAIDLESSGTELVRVTNSLAESGLLLGGEVLKSQPRGFAPDHPRIGLLRHKTITVSRRYRPGAQIRSREMLDAVRRDWRNSTSLLEWLAQHG